MTLLGKWRLHYPDAVTVCADVRLASIAGSTALMHAEACMLLLEFGPYKTTANSVGSTARVLARLTGHSEVERLLLVGSFPECFAAPGRGSRDC